MVGVHKGFGDELKHHADGETKVLRGQVAYPDVRAEWLKWEKNPSGLCILSPT